MFVNPRDAIHSAMDLGNPVKPIDIVKNAPPARMNAIMHEVLVAPIKLAKNVLKFNEPCKVAKDKAPTTPNAAASVGVAQPMYIEPITKIISEKIGIKNFELLIFSIMEIWGSFGGIFFLFGAP